MGSIDLPSSDIFVPQFGQKSQPALRGRLQEPQINIFISISLVFIQDASILSVFKIFRKFCNDGGIRSQVVSKSTYFRFTRILYLLTLATPPHSFLTMFETRSGILIPPIIIKTATKPKGLVGGSVYDASAHIHWWRWWDSNPRLESTNIQVVQA